MSLRLVLPTALAAAALAGAAHAEDAPVATGRPQPAATPAPAADDPVVQLEAIPSRDGLGPEDGQPAPDRKPHGYVSVGVGTGGYRTVAAGVAAPVGKGGYVEAEVATGRIDARRR